MPGSLILKPHIIKFCLNWFFIFKCCWAIALLEITRMGSMICRRIQSILIVERMLRCPLKFTHKHYTNISMLSIPHLFGFFIHPLKKATLTHRREDSEETTKFVGVLRYVIVRTVNEHWLKAGHRWQTGRSEHQQHEIHPGEHPFCSRVSIRIKNQN